MLNPDLDRKSLTAQFAEDGRLRIDNVLRPEIAERIRKYCLVDIPFDYLSYVEGTNVAIPAEAMAALETAEQRDMQDKILANASEGVGFFYCGYMAARSQRDGCNENLQFLHSVFDYLNGEEMLSFINEITGRDDLQSAFAQYTRYTPGQFLTRHQDDITNEQRHIAYVLGFSKNWHPDWGGLLQFFEADGTPRDAWLPAFNTMSLFDVRHVHSVTYVTPFAKEQRLSLTGLFRSTPPDADD